MSALLQLHSSLWIDLKRYLRSPGLLLVALAVPVAAHYMVPDQDASYAVMTVNGVKPVLTAPVLGLELGVLAATLLTPLAYIFLRAGPTRHQPWQISDVAPHSRVLSILGRWAADTAALWMLLMVLTLAGLVLGVFRIEGKNNFFQTIIGLWLPAAPALALVAAIRLFLDARNITRRWLGDLTFFIAWIFLTVMGILSAEDPETKLMVSRPFTDVFGFISPIIGSVNYPVTNITIGGATNMGNSISVDAWQGITDATYVQARLFWLAISAGLAMLAGFIWEPMKTRQPKFKKSNLQDVTVAPRASISDIAFKAPAAVAAGSTNYLAVIISEIRIILKSKAWLICLAVVAIMGALFSFRTIAGPAILLILIFPLTEASSRWQAKSTRNLLDTLGTGKIQRTVLLFIASLSVAALVLLPACFRMIITGEWQWVAHIGAMIFLAPALIIAAGYFTRSAVTGRMIMLIIWYIYLSSATF